MPDYSFYEGTHTGAQIDSLLNKIDSSETYTSAEKSKLAGLENAVDGQQNTTASGGNGYAIINGIRVYASATAPTGDIPDGSVGVGW